MSLYTRALRQLLFLLPPEMAHDLTIQCARWCPRAFHQSVPDKPTTLMGIPLKNPVGLAAGLDKDGVALKAWQAMGFGYVEIGSVTPKPQRGNPKPRLFRLPAYHAIINRMGFNSQGMDAVARHLAHKPEGLVLGVNLGKNKETPLEEAYLDYQQVLETLYIYGDYFTLNLSSPNTPGLRTLQQSEYIVPLIKAVQETLNKCNAVHGTKKPLAVKIAPDLTQVALDELIDVLMRLQVDAIITSNTTIARDGIAPSQVAQQAGGLSGAPLANRASEQLSYIHEKTQGAVPLVGVGGIMDASSAKARLAAGASAIQIYTGLIYEGPQLIKNIVQAL